MDRITVYCLLNLSVGVKEHTEAGSPMETSLFRALVMTHDVTEAG